MSGVTIYVRLRWCVSNDISQQSLDTGLPFIRSCPPHLDQVIHIYRFVYETSTLFRSYCIAWRLARFC
eukprot:11608531-Ditylum_brightwellii.AAC.1